VRLGELVEESEFHPQWRIKVGSIFFLFLSILGVWLGVAAPIPSTWPINLEFSRNSLSNFFHVENQTGSRSPNMHQGGDLDVANGILIFKRKSFGVVSPILEVGKLILA
jgi:hypothetical protein